MAKGDGEEALKWSKEQNDYRPHSRYLGYMAAIYGHAGNDEMAKSSLDAFLAQRPEITTLSDYETVVPTICKDFLMGGLAKAGLPEA